jgi:hypothetical protein
MTLLYHIGLRYSVNRAAVPKLVKQPIPDEGMLIDSKGEIIRNTIEADRESQVIELSSDESELVPREYGMAQTWNMTD